MKKTCILLCMLLSVVTSSAQRKENLTIKTPIDKVYAFGFDFSQSRSAKGAIWNVKKAKAVTPQNYSEAKLDTIEGQPVVKLYREVGLGNHPLNGWETWKRKGKKWVCIDGNVDKPKH